MVSGSSDCSVCIWDLHLGATLDQDDSSSIDDFQTGSAKEETDREVNGEVRQILRGHAGGVLDLRIDNQWIVSWWVVSGFFALFSLGHLFLAVAPKMPLFAYGTGRPLSYTAPSAATRGLSMQLDCRAAKWCVWGYFSSAGCSPDFRLAPAETAK